MSVRLDAFWSQGCRWGLMEGVTVCHSALMKPVSYFRCLGSSNLPRHSVFGQSDALTIPFKEAVV